MRMQYVPKMRSALWTSTSALTACCIAWWACCTVALPSLKLSIGPGCAQDCMVGLLFAFMPVLAGSRGGGGDQLEVLRLLVKCAPRAGTSRIATLLAYGLSCWEC